MKTTLQQLKEEMQRYTWGVYNPFIVIDKYFTAERSDIESAYAAGKRDQREGHPLNAPDYFTQTYKTTDEATDTK